MIESIEYEKGNLHVKIDGHRHVLESAKTLSSGERIRQSDLSNELPLVKTIAEAVLPLKKRSGSRVRFNPKTGCVLFSGREITPDTPLDDLPDDVKAFSEAVRTDEVVSAYNNLKPPEYEMEEVEVKEVVVKDGIPTLVTNTRLKPKTQRVRVKNEDGTLAFKRSEDRFGQKIPLWADVPVLKRKQV